MTEDSRGAADEEDGVAGDDTDQPLDDVSDGAGCAEIWERLSDRRRDARTEEGQE